MCSDRVSLLGASALLFRAELAASSALPASTAASAGLLKHCSKQAPAMTWWVHGTPRVDGLDTGHV